MVKLKQSGFLLIEVLITIAILTGLVLLFIPAIQHHEESLSKREKILDMMALNSALDDQFKAQFQRLGRIGCASGEGQWVEIGDWQSKPVRLKSDNLDRGSDWLKGLDIGLCAAYGNLSGQQIEVAWSCDDLDVGDNLHVSSCGQDLTAKVLSNSQGIVTALSSDASLFGEVLVYQTKGFYWYVKQGKAGANALWRRPEESGNALELMTGLEHVRFYPVLDRDLDGVVDAVGVNYGEVPLRQLKGVLIEYLYGTGHCGSPSQTLHYQTLRGDQWDYDGLCLKVGKQLIALGEPQ